MDLYFMFWYFVIYAFLGWCTEVVYAAVCTGKFVNRGFLNGPVCPIYGFGVITIITSLTPVKGNLAILFLGSVILTSALEFVTGWMLEKIFHTKWWDYSDTPFNIGGYICLKFSFIWGLACVMIVIIIHPLIQELVWVVNYKAGKIILATMLTVMSVDFTATVQTMLKLNRQLNQINSVALKIKALSDEIGEVLYSESIAIMEKSEAMKTAFAEQKTSINELMDEKISEAGYSIDKLKASVSEKNSKIASRRLLYAKKLEDLTSHSFFGQKRLLNAFPNLKSTSYANALEELKKKILPK